MSRRFGVQSLPLALAALTLACSTLVATPAGAISHRRLFQPTGAAAHDQLGQSVSGAGDVNGDGYADVIVGAAQNPSLGTSPGNAYVYFGGPAADATADLTLTGAALGDRFGYSVASAGDVNGDGFDDLIVGARGNDAGGAEAGRAYVYLGGPTLDATADLTLTGAAAGDEFGYSVASAGDVNGDGFDDLIVGANLNDAAGSAAGRAYVYFGSPAPDINADLILTGNAAFDQFGTSVASAGDVNGDGFDDLFVGANFNDATGQNAGAAYVFFGGPAANASADLVLTGVAEGDKFGISVASAGDVNGDGFADLIVGADEASNWLFGGAAYVYLGGPNADATADVTISATDAYAGVGTSVASAGDLNADGYADWIVGISGGGLGGEPARAHVYFGGPWPDATVDVVLVGDTPNEVYGASVASAGDVDGDGFVDLIVGAWTSAVNGTYTGRAYVTAFFPYNVLSPNGGERWVAGQQATVRWRGHDPADLSASFDGGANWSTLAAQVGGLSENEHVVTVPATATEFAMVRLSYSGQAAERSTSDASDAVFRIILPTATPSAATRLERTFGGEATGDNFGTSLANAGDFNGDGHTDLIVGASSNDAAGVNAGRAYVYYRGPNADAVADVILTGAAAGDVFGSVGSAGDFNSDGYADVIVGASGNDAGGSASGRAYVYFGGATPNAVADVTLTGAAAGDQFGRTVANAGDVNGDGYADLIIGANTNDVGGADAGRAYVYFSGPIFDPFADMTLTGAAAGDNFGYSLAGAGDVNGDGFADVIVGAIWNDAGGANAGRAYVYFGGAAPDAIADLVLTGEAAADNFGSTVAGAGDLDGDGYSDVIVGAPSNSAGGVNAGRAYVYFGGLMADAVPDQVMTGAGETDEFGTRVAGVGDVNADGYSDVAVSAWASDVGRVDLFYGGLTMNTVPDLSLSNDPEEENFGQSISGAGDANGDGFADLVIGATGFGSSTGRAYLYDCNRYVVVSPNDDEVWNVGASQAIRWLGAEPADLWLSTDGGGSYSLLRSGVGGEDQNSVTLLVPHSPTRFARVKVTPADLAIAGQDESDSLFTIQSSVALLNLVATLGDDGAELTWGTEPTVGAQGLAGYRVYRLHAGDSGNGTRVGPELIVESHYTDASGAAGNSYRLVAVNGLHQELELGRVSLAPRAALAAWPRPYRDGALNVSFGVSGRFGSTLGEATVELFDLGGRKKKTLASGSFESGFHTLRWDGRDDRGERVRSGIYFLRATSGGESHKLRLVILQ